MKKILFSGLILAYTMATAQTVNIPDPVFKEILVKHKYPKIDTNDDGEISVAEAEAVTTKLDISDKSINDVTGLEAFKNVEEIQMYYNGGTLSLLDLNGNTALKKLTVEGSNLTSLNLSQNTALENLNCNVNSLSSLDLSHNPNLKILECGENQLTNLDVSNNTALENITCYDNQLENLNLTNNTQLTYLSAYNNELKDLDISANTALTQIDLENNKLESFNASQNPNLIKLILKNNKLSNLDISFGDYMNFSDLDIRDNTALTCVRITTGQSPSSTWQQDAGVTYSDACGTMAVQEVKADQFVVYPNPTNDVVYVKSFKTPSEIVVYDLAGHAVLKKSSQNSVNLKSLNKGVYLLHIVVDGQKVVKKIVRN